jgi:hypothetical protein
MMKQGGKKLIMGPGAREIEKYLKGPGRKILRGAEGQQRKSEQT